MNDSTNIRQSTIESFSLQSSGLGALNAFLNDFQVLL